MTCGQTSSMALTDTGEVRSVNHHVAKNIRTAYPSYLVKTNKTSVQYMKPPPVTTSIKHPQSFVQSPYKFLKFNHNFFSNIPICILTFLTLY